MSGLQRAYELQQQNINTIDLNFGDNAISSSKQENVVWNTSSNTNAALKSCWDETTTANPLVNQREETVKMSIDHATAAESTTKRLTCSQTQVFIIGLILGSLVSGSATVGIVIHWKTSGSGLTTSSTSMMNTTTLIKTTTASVTTTTSKTTTSSTSTSTSTTTTTSTTSTSTRSTTTSTTTTTTTTAPPSTLCVYTTGESLINNQFIYSPTSQLYAAGMLNNQFGIYQAYGYGNVTSRITWAASQSSTSVPCSLALQTDRNLVIYPVNISGVFWASNTQNSGSGYPFCLEMLDSGNLIWIDNTTSIIWQANSTIQSG